MRFDWFDIERVLQEFISVVLHTAFLINTQIYDGNATSNIYDLQHQPHINISILPFLWGDLYNIYRILDAVHFLLENLRPPQKLMNASAE